METNMAVILILLCLLLTFVGIRNDSKNQDEELKKIMDR